MASKWIIILLIFLFSYITVFNEVPLHFSTFLFFSTFSSCIITLEDQNHCVIFNLLLSPKGTQTSFMIIALQFEPLKQGGDIRQIMFSLCRLLSSLTTLWWRNSRDLALQQGNTHADQSLHWDKVKSVQRAPVSERLGSLGTLSGHYLELRH